MLRFVVCAQQKHLLGVVLVPEDSRGLRRKRQQAAAEAAAAADALGAGLTPPPIPALQVCWELPLRSRASQTWAMLIKRVYEIDPLSCPECGGQMKVVAFIEPPQGDVIEKILRHCGLWCPSSPRAPPAGDLHVHDPDRVPGTDLRGHRHLRGHVLTLAGVCRVRRRCVRAAHSTPGLLAPRPETPPKNRENASDAAGA